MRPGTLFAELKRRNLYKVGAAYAIVAWLLMQVASQIFPFFEIPNWVLRLVVFLLLIGFPIALIIAWAWLQIAFDKQDAGMLSLLVDPVLRGLHDGPRYKNLLAKRGLSAAS